MNIVQLIGHLGQDAELRSVGNDLLICTTSLATNRVWDKDGDKKEETDWHFLKAFGKTAEILGEHKKGDMIYIRGRVSYNKWVDEEGKNRKSTEIIANLVYKIEKKKPKESFSNIHSTGNDIITDLKNEELPF